jgi:hypothetical protein
MRVGGDIAIGWIRRSRTGAQWGDADTPLGEESERYRLTIGAARTIETDVPHYLYTAAQQAADGHALGDSITITVAQIGTLAASLPATITITL